MLSNKFFYLQADDLFLNKSAARIDDIWKRVLLNKSSLISIRLENENDSYIDVQAEREMVDINCFRRFNKRGI